MFNLAPLRYANILGSQTGPIERIEYGRVEILGNTYYQANAYLNGQLGLRKSHLQIYSNADGSGTHRSPMLARYIAISEAIERWALYILCGSQRASEFGFDVDASSNGMSAFPGVFRFQARRKAMAEAAERFCLVSWWDGRLPSKPIASCGLPVEGIEIFNPASKDKVVLLWKLSEGGYYTYGFASDRKLKDAAWKAYVEMDRSNCVLDNFYSENPGFESDDLSTIGNHQERRVVYFSMPEGHREFRRRLEQSDPTNYPRKVKPIIDREIEGPWDRYAKVWRVVLPMPTREYLNPNSNFFFW